MTDNRLLKLIPRIHEQMTDKKLCGLRSVPSLFRLFANGVHCCPPKRRRDYKETALLFGRVAGCLTWSVNARSRHCSACLGYSPPDRLCRRSTSGGSAAGRLTAPPPPPSAGSLCSALLRSAPWVVFCLRSAPTMLKKKIAKGFAFHNFFSNKNTTNPTIYPNFAL